MIIVAPGHKPSGFLRRAHQLPSVLEDVVWGERKRLTTSAFLQLIGNSVIAGPGIGALAGAHLGRGAAESLGGDDIAVTLAGLSAGLAGFLVCLHPAGRTVISIYVAGQATWTAGRVGMLLISAAIADETPVDDELEERLDARLSDLRIDSIESRLGDLRIEIEELGRLVSDCRAIDAVAAE